MKRTVLLGLLVVSMSLSATAIYDPNNTVTGPDEKSQGDLKVTRLNSTAEISDYSMDFMHMDGRCGAVNADDVSINPREVSSGNNTVVVEGVFQTPHPRYNLTSNVEKTGDKYVLRIKGLETSKAAPRCIGNIDYHAHFSAPKNATLEIHHNQTEITEKEIQEIVTSGQESPGENRETEKPETETGQRPEGLFVNILGSITSIF